jgi:hypothetical protein
MVCFPKPKLSSSQSPGHIAVVQYLSETKCYFAHLSYGRGEKE